MEEASYQRDHITSTSMEKQSSVMTPPTYVQFQTLSPIWRPSPWHNGSTLYDSYELRAVTHQLNKAIQSSNGSSSPCAFSFKSPFYRQHLDRIYKENAKTPKRISCSQSAFATLDRKTGARNARGFVSRLWKKVKQGIARRSRLNHDPKDLVQ